MSGLDEESIVFEDELHLADAHRAHLKIQFLLFSIFKNFSIQKTSHGSVTNYVSSFDFIRVLKHKNII